MDPIPSPNHLDEQPILLFWSADELLPAVALICVGILVSQKIVFLFLAALAVRAYRRTNEGRQDGYMLHLLYWWGFVSKKGVRTMPNPFCREYLP